MSSPMTACIASRALLPRAGFEECPERPVRWMDISMMPLWAWMGRRPVGSPMTAARALGLPMTSR